MGRRRRQDAARTSLAGLLIGGGALAIVEVLQQVAGVFDPSSLSTVLIAVSVALGAAAAAKWRARAERGAKLSDELRAWPLPLLRKADPDLLGVFPSR
jgi:hypothetical protein